MRSSKLGGFAGFAFGVAGVCWLVLPPVAAADSPDARFDAMDTNGDGRISPDEYSAAAARMFEKMDANGDGKVTAAELDAARQRMLGQKPVKTEKGELSAAEKIKTIDTNGDGVLTADEHAVGARAMFDKMDTDDDSYLTKTEIKTGHEKNLKKPAK